MATGLDIGRLAEYDRTGWDRLVRLFHSHFTGRPGEPAMEVDEDEYAQTWHRLVDGRQVRGIRARLDGDLVGIAHYLFHPGVWGAGRCYLADLFVDPQVRRRGVATALIEWVARDAEDHGSPRLYWNTEVDADARALYDRIAVHRGFIVYNYSRRPAPGAVTS